MIKSGSLYLSFIAVIFFFFSFSAPAYSKNWQFSCGPDLKQQWKLTLREKGKNEQQVEITDVILHGKNYIISLNAYSDQQGHGEHYWMSKETYMVTDKGKKLWGYVHKEHGINDPLYVYGRHNSSPSTIKIGNKIYRNYYAKRADVIGTSDLLYTLFLVTLDINGKPVSVNKLKGRKISLGTNIFYDSNGDGVLYSMGCHKGLCRLVINSGQEISLTKKMFGGAYQFNHIKNIEIYNRTVLLDPKTVLHPYKSGILGENVFTKAIKKIKGLVSSSKNKKSKNIRRYTNYKIVNISKNGKVVWSKDLPFKANLLHLIKHKKGFTGYYVPANAILKDKFKRSIAQRIVHIELDNRGNVLSKKSINLPDSFHFYGGGRFGGRQFYGYHLSRAKSVPKYSYLVVVKEKSVKLIKVGTGLNARISKDNYLFFGSYDLYLCR